MSSKRLRYIASIVRAQFPACAEELERIANGLEAYDAPPKGEDAKPESIKLTEQKPELQVVCTMCNNPLYPIDGKQGCLNTTCAAFRMRVG